MVDPKGHQASSPWQMPRAAWKDIAVRTYKRVWDDNVGLVAAGVHHPGVPPRLAGESAAQLVARVFPHPERTVVPRSIG